MTNFWKLIELNLSDLKKEIIKLNKKDKEELEKEYVSYQIDLEEKLLNLNSNKFNFISDSTSIEFARYILEKQGEKIYNILLSDINYIIKNKENFTYITDNGLLNLKTIGVYNNILFKTPISELNINYKLYLILT
jgi:hypothetical protein